MDGLIGKTFGPYRILEQIGRGGMATVYKAYQPSLDRYVAVKVLPSHLSKEAGFSQRFRREARAVAKLEHPHILAVHDFGQEDELSYIAMRYVDAGTLKDLTGQPLDLVRIASLIGQIAEALDHAHEHGIVHRDVKPSNVLLDRGEWVLLTDFGLARMMEGSQQITATGVGIGTPDYMSPEQGQAKRADRRSDVYSLGVVLYEMLTGEVPYQAETPIAVVLKHINEPLPLPRDVNPEIPEAMERVVLKAMAKAPEDRYQTAGELARALQAAAQEAATAKERSQLADGVLTQDVLAEMSGPASTLARLRKFQWVIPAALLVVAAVVLLSRVPLRVQISDGQLEVLRVVDTLAPQSPVPTLTTSPNLDKTITLSPSPLGMPATISPSWTDEVIFEAVGPMNTARSHHTATLLSDDMVLVVGGWDNEDYFLSSVELYDPHTDTWSTTGSTNVPRDNHTATLLNNGKVLVAGGSGIRSLQTAELYDPETGTWSMTAGMNDWHESHTATLLRNGQVLVVGCTGSANTGTTELYDPNTGAWSVTGYLNDGRCLHTATLLNNGKVLVAGGGKASSGTGGLLGEILSSAELYDPETGTWSMTGSMNTGRAGHTATLLGNGQILVRGDSDMAELYDPETGIWSITGAKQTPLPGHTATLLSNDKVLVVGGWITDLHRAWSGAELYDPETGTWSMTGSMNTSRANHTATLLRNGDVLVVGGEANWKDQLNSVELAHISPDDALTPPLSTSTTPTVTPTGPWLIWGDGCQDSPLLLPIGGGECEFVYGNFPVPASLNIRAKGQVVLSQTLNFDKPNGSYTFYLMPLEDARPGDTFTVSVNFEEAGLWLGRAGIINGQ